MANESIESRDNKSKRLAVAGFVCGVLSAVALIAAGVVFADSSSQGDVAQRLPLGLLTVAFAWWVTFGPDGGKQERMKIPVGFVLCLLLGIALANT